jgi:SAM-dependent methyltransferase
MTHAFNTSVPNVARIYDAMLGGKSNYAADREAAMKVIKIVPEAPLIARQNRLFLQRAVSFLAGEAGIGQFIDLGSGLPTMQNVHEVAQQANPQARVAYVDHDTIVVSHARGLLGADAQLVTVVEADIRRPGGILGDPALRAVIDLGQPVAVLLVAIMHFIHDEDKPHQLVSALKDAMAPGSYLVMSHAALAPLGDDRADGLRSVYAATESGGVTPRSHPEVMRFFDGFRLIDPGLVDIGRWRPELGGQPMDPPMFYGGVAVSP